MRGYMNREVAFGQTLEQIKRKGKEQGGVISAEEIAQAFAAFSLDTDQLAMIHDYLQKHGIGIGEPMDVFEGMEEADRNYLEWYLKEIALSEPPGEGRQEAVILSAMAGDAAAKKELIGLFLPQVADMARLYAGQGADMEDLVGEGNMALVMGVELLGALESAQEAWGMLGRQVMDAMDRLVAEHARNGDIGKMAAQRVNQVADAAKELSDALLRKVTVQELAQETEMTVEEIQEALRLSAGKIEEIEDANDRRKP